MELYLYFSIPNYDVPRHRDYISILSVLLQKIYYRVILIS
jgi:hypothetical protein